MATTARMKGQDGMGEGKRRKGEGEPCSYQYQ